MFNRDKDSEFINFKVTIHFEVPRNLVKWIRAFFDTELQTWKRVNPSYKTIKVEYEGDE